MRSEIAFKYCKVSFNEEYDNEKPLYWTTVDFAWGDKANQKAVAFSMVMDLRIRDKAREILKPLLNVEDKDIALEDTWLMIQGYDASVKHNTANIIGIVKAVENQFDKMIEEG